MKPSREPTAAVAEVVMVVVAAAVVVVTAAVVIATTIATSVNRVGSFFGAATPPPLPLLSDTTDSKNKLSLDRLDLKAKSVCPTHDFDYILFARFHLSQGVRVIVNILNLAGADLDDAVAGFHSGLRRR